MNILSTDKAPGAIGPYSQGYEVNGVVYTSGQIPVDPADGTVAEGIAAQAEQSCRNVGAILEAAGTGFDKVFKTTCFLADMNDLVHLMRCTQRISYPSQPEAAWQSRLCRRTFSAR